MSEASSNFRLVPVRFADLPGWNLDDPRVLWVAMNDCRNHLQSAKPYKMGAAGLTSDDLIPLLDSAGTTAPPEEAEARAFFEKETKPFRIELGGKELGLVTAFYEPEVEVSDRPDSVYCHPFYRRPDDLVDVDATNRPPDLDPSYVFAMQSGDGLRPYPDRRQIDEGWLEGRGLEIAWARSRVDVFFAHVQGAARLRFPDGRRRRITYAAKAGHAFSGIGRLLIDLGEIPEAEISMQSIRAWLAEHVERVDEILWHNRSYIFFREAEVEDPARGPIAAAKVPLLAGRSLAVDRQIHTFGFPFFIHAPGLTHMDGGRDFSRTMLALDTGSAIVGPARGDIFTGSGPEAGELAGAVRCAADFYILIPKQAAERFV
ncbi:membrane-bound lytic murein transglycosylase A [Peteryoungia aggregata LMG 23059]|uniref:peptidoglycan lytic exotransglycosylase n=1 Tax=Peteryoungia aggregata LMG 23059 TaxID=1368425 RepID=A0ABU0G9T7_9HYPH|nr:murein transglycosylase A [Peteryoungia aggregata]MDQ0422118.1 membrane-bound lytic murein transglycosylase A [Peteryoungia aggregata LMG 23059]